MASDRSSSHASINDPLWNVENNQSESLSFSLPLESNKPQPEPLVEHFLADPSFERSIASSSAHTSADPPSEQCIAPFSAQPIPSLSSPMHLHHYMLQLIPPLSSPLHHHPLLIWMNVVFQI